MATEEKKVNKKEENGSPKEEKKAETEAKKTSPKLEKLVEEIGNLSVLEISELVLALEEKLGVSAAIPVAATSVAAAGGQTAEAEAAAPEQATFNVILTSAGANKISVIKAVREINQNLGLKDAKDLVESAPKEILSGVNKETAQEAKKKLEEAGATVELK